MARFRRDARVKGKDAPPVSGVQVERLSHEGRGVARVNGKIVFIDGALPGETVTLRYTRLHGQYDEATVLAVETPSPDRIEPKCAHAERCGGCSLQHLAPEAQVAHKQAVLLELLAHHAKITPERVLPPVLGPQWAYRRRARLSVRNVIKRGETLIGFREKASHFVTDISRCETLLPAVGEHLLALRALLGGLSVADHIPQVEVSAGDDDIALLIRHTQPLSAADRASLADYGQTRGLRMYAQPGDLSTIERLDAADAPLHYQTDGLEIEFRPGDFVQINAGINAQLVPLALDMLALSADDVVLDLFAGLGNFTLPIANHAASVVGVEGEPGLVRRAQANAERLGLVNAHFAVADLFSEAGIAAIPREPYSKLLLDPPRSGALEVLNALRLKWVERVCYVSCNPVTLARDAAVLVGKHGFRLAAAGVLDMFPHTTHVESIALFTRG